MAVGIIGMGYVGLPLAVAFAAEGRDVVAVDVDRRKVEALRGGDSYIEDVADAADLQPRARPRPARRGHAGARRGAAGRAARRARVDDLSGHDPRARGTD